MIWLAATSSQLSGPVEAVGTTAAPPPLATDSVNLRPSCLPHARGGEFLRYTQPRKPYGVDELTRGQTPCEERRTAVCGQRE